MKEVKDTLEERGSIYGDYKSGVELRASVMELLVNEYMTTNDEPMSALHRGYLWDIVNKLCRIAVTPEHADSWHDIQGYARLVEIAVSRPSIKAGGFESSFDRIVAADKKRKEDA